VFLWLGKIFYLCCNGLMFEKLNQELAPPLPEVSTMEELGALSEIIKKGNLINEGV